MSVMTVLGPVESDALGIVLPHEHILSNLSCLWSEPKDPSRKHLVEADISLRLRGQLQSDPYHCKSNMLLDEQNLAIDELLLFKNSGGGTVVDLSSSSIGPFPKELKQLALATGLHIVAGCGYYTKRSHPSWISKSSITNIAERMIQDLLHGFEGTEIKAGVIGEIGSSSPIHADEEKVLRAAAFAQKQTGAGINVHLPIFAREGHNVLEILEQEGADLSRVALSHLDEAMDPAYHVELASRGVFIEFDCFGSEFYFDEDGLREPSDHERIQLLMKLLDAGYLNQILLSQDVCTKLHLCEYGGYGYAHILRSIVPRLSAIGLGKNSIDQMLIHNPRRFLDS